MNARTNISTHIHQLRGSLELRPGEKTATQELLEDRAWEKANDEEKYRRWEARLRRCKLTNRRKANDT